MKPLQQMKSLQPHQQRVVEEHFELKAKADKLDHFFPSAIFELLPLAEKVRLRDQINYMRLYQKILEERIAAFE